MKMTWIQNNPIQAKVYQELDGLPTWDGNYGIVAEVIGHRRWSSLLCYGRYFWLRLARHRSHPS